MQTEIWQVFDNKIEISTNIKIINTNNDVYLHLHVKLSPFKNIDLLTHLRGVQAYHYSQKDFELEVEGEGQDTSRHFEGSFGSIRAILPCDCLGANTGEKPKSEVKKIELSYCHYSICLQKTRNLEKNVKIG